MSEQPPGEHGRSKVAEMPAADDPADDPADDGYDASCMTCGGEGHKECDDFDSSEGCWTHPACMGYGFCPNCRGSGLAKDQWYW